MASRLNTSMILCAFVATGVTSTGVAQESTGIEEIIVTAQKREESLQKVPISMSAITATDIETKGIRGFEDLYTQVPNMSFSPHPSSQNTPMIYIRGIGLVDDQLAQDQSTGVYLNGVYIARPQGMNINVADLERIEVLRGPQGTLYGRNTTAGAINFISKTPSTEGISFFQRFTAGDRDLLESYTSLNIPMSDSVAARFSFLRGVQDGFVRNRGTGSDYFGSTDRWALMADFLWRMNESVDVRYTYDRSDLGDSSAYVAIAPNGYGTGRRPSKGSPAVRDFHDNDIVGSGHALTVEWAINEYASLKSLTAYRELDSSVYQDYLTGAFGPFPTFATNYNVDHDQFSQEFHVVGNMLNQKLDYIAGVYYFHEKGDGFDIIWTPMSGVETHRMIGVKNKSYAVFGQATYTPNFLESRLHVTIGARWSKDSREAKMQQAFGPIGGTPTPPANLGDGDKTFSDFSPSLVVAFDLNDKANIYAKVVKGYKTGGFNPRASSIVRFNEGYGKETLVSIEAGIKSRWLNDRVQVNAAVFRAEYDDMQVNTLSDGNNPTVTDLLNAGEATIKGVEMDVVAVLTHGLSVGFNYGYVDPEYKKIKTFTGTNIANEFRFIHVPKNNYAVNVDYRHDNLSVGTLRVNINYTWQGDEFSNTPRIFGTVYGIKSYGLINARLSYGDVPFLDGELEFSVWGKNLEDKEYLTAHFNSGLSSGIYGTPRTVGADITYRY